MTLGVSAARDASPPPAIFVRILAYRLQADHLGDLDSEMSRLLDRASTPAEVGKRAADFNQRRTELRPGTMLVREWDGDLHKVMVLADGFAWKDKTFESLSRVAFAITGARWNGPRFSACATSQPTRSGHEEWITQPGPVWDLYARLHRSRS
jgi:hypothetical protein